MYLRKLMAAAAGLLASVVAVTATAGQFSVTPIRIFMAPKDRAVAVTITNEGNEELVMQADVFVWAQERDGDDKLTPSEDLFLSPPIIKIAPNSRQVVRLALLQKPRAGAQKTYRMIVREIPEAKKNKKPKGMELDVALAFSIPVFVTPPGARRVVDCQLARPGLDVLQAVCANTGTAYAQIRELKLTDLQGTELAARDAGGYLLPDVTRSLALKSPTGRVPAGKASLAVTFDDGTIQKYDVTVPEK